MATIVAVCATFQHHAAQLNLIPRQTIDSASGWVRKAKDTLSGG
jgi:hypothetical protein